jgi:3-hydroxybutyryl-CoA dehydrogenase
MSVNTIGVVGVIGAGAVGREIAYAAACAGYRTVLEDVSPEMLEKGVDYIRKAFEQDVVGGAVTGAQREFALTNLTTARRVEDACRQADLLIEAAPEDMELQLEIFTIFDKFAKPNAILASSTVSISITELAAITFRAENCVGMHFVRSSLDRKLLEIVRAHDTSEETVQACAEAGRRMGKEVVIVCEPPGLIS